MYESNINTEYVCENIAKVRWVDEERFITGSWNMPKNNFVKIWHLFTNQHADDFSKYDPRSSDKIAFTSDITGLEFVAREVAVSSCAEGFVTLLRVHCGAEADSLQELGRSSVLHKFDSDSPASCTAISVNNKDIATVGEDGRLNIIDTSTVRQVYQTIDADSCSLMAVAYVSPKEVLTANRMGIIRIFDVRASAETTEVISFINSTQDGRHSNYVSCLASHPTQPHVVLAANEEGSITVWDLRKPGFPASYLSAHDRAINEIAFHRTDPTKLITASDAGELWLWSHQPLLSMHHSKDAQTAENMNPWLKGEHVKSRIELNSLITNLNQSINSFDTLGSRVICGGDNEALHFIDDIMDSVRLC